MHPDASTRIGIDLGGTKIEVIVLDAAGAVLLRERVPTPAGDYAGTLAAIAGLVQRAQTQTNRDATVGICIPGTLSTDHGRVKNANSVWLNGQALDADLAALLRRPVRIANDADCFALSEATDGAGAGAGTVFGVILGTGVGGGIVAHGRLLAGPNGICGEWGHNPLPWATADDAARPCYCGLSGCIETFLSGPGFAAEYAARTGTVVPAPDILRRARAGEPAAGAALQRYIDRLARALAAVINLLDPEVIVLGGGMSNIAELYAGVPARWQRQVFSDAVHTRLCPALHGDSSGVRGAAWLWHANRPAA